MAIINEILIRKLHSLKIFQILILYKTIYLYICIPTTRLSFFNIHKVLIYYIYLYKTKMEKHHILFRMKKTDRLFNMFNNYYFLNITMKYERHERFNFLQ